MKHTNKRYFVYITIFLSLIVQPVHLSATTNNPLVTVIGTGYVGLVTGAGLAKLGNTVICADVDSEKIALLKNGVIPIYEPGLKEVVDDVVSQEKLSFTNNVSDAIKQGDIIFIAVGTPMGDDGSADLSYVQDVVNTIADHITNYKIICTKSTVPVGTGFWIKKLLQQKGIAPELFDVVSNPEFLREGSAVGDFLEPDRVVIGVETEKAAAIMRSLYKQLFDNGTPCVMTNIPTSETIKYASNAFLATKISFINEMANFCDATGADTKTVAYAMGLDNRIEAQFLNPGPGFGGSCFPKDTQALVYAGTSYGVDFAVVNAAIQANDNQKNIPIKKLLKHIDFVENKTIAVLGLAFKANTDDIRYSSSIRVIEQLLARGAQVKAYDPQAMSTMQQLFPNITYCQSSYEAITNANAILIMTEWPEFKELDFEKVAQLVAHRTIVDTRNILDIQKLKQLGFTCDTIGRNFLV